MEHRHNPDAPARRDELEGEGAIRGTARMEAFADGVFAIAMNANSVSFYCNSFSVSGSNCFVIYHLINLLYCQVGFSDKCIVLNSWS